jgi:phosphoglycolate phosphatase-like HAD superfamily hydrolase
MTAINSYLDYVQDHTLPIKTPIISPDAVFQFEKDNPKIFSAFSKLIPMGNFAEDYFVMFEIINTNEVININGQSDFDDYKKQLPKNDLSSFQNIFYSKRSSMQKKDPESWSQLLQPFPGIVEAIKSLSNRFILAIATSKDRPSLNICLKKYGLSNYFLPENILDKDFAKTKRIHLIRLHEMHSIDYENIIFIDDKLLHLISVKDLKVRKYLAFWGFNTQKEHEHAIREGFTLLKIEDLINLE